jgi:RNA polymerase sigma factor (sigma-70 family)
MDHFAKPSDAMSKALLNGTLQRNFQGYSTLKGVDLHGMGMSSISHAGGHYFQNKKELSAYYADLDAGKLPLLRGYSMTAEDRIRYDAIMYIMCNLFIDYQKLTEQLGRDPSDKEIAKEVNLTERTVTGLRLGKTTTISLHDPIQHGEDGEFRDIIPDEKTTSPDEIVQDEEALRHMLKLTDKLDERERTILDLRFGLNGERPRTLEEVSQTIGRTRERVRQIQNQALDKLRAMLEEDGMETAVA